MEKRVWLAVVHRFADALNCRVQVKSWPPHGSAFRIWLPLSSSTKPEVRVLSVMKHRLRAIYFRSRTGLYRLLGAKLATPLRRVMQTAYCSCGQHLGDSNYCAYGSGTLLRPGLCRRWSVAPHDGTTIVEIIATNETEAIS